MLKLFNTLNRKIEIFRVRKNKKVGIYICGPTVYGPSHLGHARTYIVFDILHRHLKYLGYQVKFVTNITDIHDDLIKEAKKKNTTIKELSRKFTNLYFQDLKKLNILKADKYPKVSDHIKEIKTIIDKLLKRGFAYQQGKAIYFDVSKFKDYGRLSGIKLKEEVTGTRVETDKYERGEVADFALWKQGRPGWHIECSAMSKKYLGEQFDIHGGSRDLIFPHHENEIAQSEATTGKKPFVKYWLHSGALLVGGKKMSRSSGNYIELPELEKKYSPLSFRHLVLTTHWQNPMNFSWKALESSDKALKRLRESIATIKNKKIKIKNKKLGKYKKAFIKALDNNLDTPQALAILWKLIHDYNKEPEKFGASETKNLIKELDKILGLELIKISSLEIPEQIKNLLKQRELLRNQKQWIKADKIRQHVQKMGYKVKDKKLIKSL